MMPCNRPCPRYLAVGIVTALLVAPVAACSPAPTPMTMKPTVPAAVSAGQPLIATPLALTDAAALEEHLRRYGVDLTFDVEQNLGFFEIPARIYHMAGDDSLEVHTYPDASAAEAAAGKVSPDGRTITSPQGSRVAVDWRGTPHFFRNGPLLVVYVGNSAPTLHALTLALGPQFAGG